jgi:hypothetical protein
MTDQLEENGPITQAAANANKRPAFTFCQDRAAAQEAQLGAARCEGAAPRPLEPARKAPQPPSPPAAINEDHRRQLEWRRARA